MQNDIEVLVKDAQNGNRDALEIVVTKIQHQVHKLAIRMLANPDDALEATQEILVLVVTKLSSFRGESAFKTWVYRIATNYLLNACKATRRHQELTFDIFKADLETGLVDDKTAPADDLIMLNELRISCTMAMLLCLDANHRMAYILGDILEFEHGEASDVLNISKANYRKRLSRARADIVAFTSRACGLANTTAKCSCPRRLPSAIAQGRIRRDKLNHAKDKTPSYEATVAMVRQVERRLKTLKLQTATGALRCPKNLGAQIASITQRLN